MPRARCARRFSRAFDRFDLYSFQMAGVKGKSGGDRRSRKAQGMPESLPLPASPGGYSRLIDVLNKPATAKEDTEDPEAAHWRPLWESGDLVIRLNASKFLSTMRDGNPRHTVNHLHDKPIQIEGVFSIALELREARERATKR
jgi:hypothetical protein